VPIFQQAPDDLHSTQIARNAYRCLSFNKNEDSGHIQAVEPFPLDRPIIGHESFEPIAWVVEVVCGHI